MDADSDAYKPRPLPACARCHDRKVKCDVSTTGIPCANCSRDGAECQLRTRKSYAPRKRRRLSHETPVSLNDSGNKQPAPPRATMATPLPNNSSGAKSQLQSNTQCCLSNEEADTHITSPLFIGDQQGIAYAPIVEDERDVSGTMHVFVEEYIAKILGPEELEYLSKMGVFTLPSPDISEALVKAYFRHIHPVLPVIDAASFLKTYDSEGVPSLNLLLLWSMFSASASFIDDSILAATGFTTRKKLKESLVKRAKSLFDIGSERDKTVLIQSAVLLSLWFADIQDVFQTWHWTGIAVNMSLNLGLHRNPDFWRKNPSFSGRRRQHWRRLWWTCVFRDRWASLSMGRPLRVNLEDCDVPLPHESDISAEVAELSETMRAKYWLSSDLARHWVCLVNMANLLGEVIMVNYRPKSTIPSQQLITRLESDVANCIPSDIDIPPRTPDESFYLDHLKLHQQVILIVLYRRYVKRDDGPDVTGGRSSKSRFNSRDKIKTAAMRCNAVIEHMVESNTTQFIMASTIALLAPPMTSHLMEARAQSALAQKLAQSRLDIFLSVLSEFVDNYPVAAMLKTVYTSVRDKSGGKTLSQELVSLRRAEQGPAFQEILAGYGVAGSGGSGGGGGGGANARKQGWDDVWLLEPFANFHWDALTPDADSRSSHMGSETYKSSSTYSGT